METNNFEAILKQYDMLGVENVIPIAHVRIKSDIGILLDSSGNFLGAMINDGERCAIPCTIDSENRTSGVSPHPIHDNMSYLCGDYPRFQKRHFTYMEQLKNYVRKVDDKLAKSVYRYLEKETIRLDIKTLLEQLDNIPEEKIMITFCTLSHRGTISRKWTEYYLSTLTPNGICGITEKEDCIPNKYPASIRDPSDRAKMFLAESKKINSMPTIAVGYAASQKIIHTLQFMIYEGDYWAYDFLRDMEDIPEQWKEWINNFEARKAKKLKKEFEE